MSRFNMVFLRIESPTDEQAANRLSIFVSRDYGAAGFQLVAMTQLDDGDLLLCLERKEEAS
jgi:hypothetical protein